MTFEGDSRWLLLHLACLDEETTQERLEWLFDLIYSSLSTSCSGNIETFLETNELPSSSGHYTRFSWSVGLHNYVNESLGKPTMTTVEAKEIYLNRRYCQI